MKRLVLIAGALALWSLLLSSCYFATKIKHLKENRKCKSTYYYTDVKGNKSIAKHCFETEDGIICKNDNYSIRALSVEEKRVCK